MAQSYNSLVVDPLKFCRQLWPDIRFYKQQQDIIYSVVDNDETFVPAGNMLGKDFVAAFLVLWFFMTRHPVRIVTTSADYSQLESVLWGEIRRLIQTAKHPLDSKKGGPIVVNHLHLRKIVNGDICGLSYCLGRVAAKGEGMLGHHIAELGDGVPKTFYLADEASGVEDDSYTNSCTWARRLLAIGNCYPCQNFFRRNIIGGDIEEPPHGELMMDRTSQGGANRLYRKIIRIRGEDSPNVRLAMAEIQAGKVPSGRMIVPGVLPYSEYRKRRTTWDPVMQCIGLDAWFYEGAEVLLYPPDWLNKSNQAADLLPTMWEPGEAMGIDVAAGDNNTAIATGNRRRLLDLVSLKTPDTSVIADRVIGIGEEYQVPSERWVFDAGGGGKFVADQVKLIGKRTGKEYNPTIINFGDPATPRPSAGRKLVDEKLADRISRMAFKNRRAEIYGILRAMIDPTVSDQVFAIPAAYSELRRQLALMPLVYGGDGGKLELPPKRKKPGQRIKCLTDIIGCSPDEADAVAMMCYGLTLDAVEGGGVIGAAW